MDSYDLFGDDGSGMLEGLPDLGGNHSYAGNPPSSVTGDTKEPSETSYRQVYSQSSVPPEGSLPKLASFASAGSGLTSGSQAVPGGGGATDYHDYGGYAPPRPRMPPPHAPPHGPPLHSAHHVHPGHSYAGYHPASDPMYSMPEHSGMTELGVWSSAPGSSRYPPITPGYRHPYDHQKIHQYPPQQGMQGVPQNGAYLPRQPHFPQPPSQSVYGQQQNYPGYPQVHPSAPSRLGPHAPYHQQMELNPHQYSLSHAQQNLANVPPQHQPHQSMTSHQSSMASNLQSSSSVHLHHAAGPALHHGGRQPPSAPTSASSGHSVPSQAPYSTAHHSVPLNYQPHQLQPSLDVNMGVTAQYSTQKPPGLDSPQYRPPFQQLSPQISPRAQMSPRPQAPPQLSPRPPISPVKGPNASPHAARAVPPPVSSGSQTNPSFNTQNTLQALEQMVLPTAGEYSYQRNPASPVVGHMVSSPSQWSQSKINTPPNSIQIQTENIEKAPIASESTIAMIPSYEQNRKGVPENKNIDFSHKIETLDKTVDEEIGISDSGSINSLNVDVSTENEPSKESNTQIDKETNSDMHVNFKIGTDNDLNIEESMMNKVNINDQIIENKNDEIKSTNADESPCIEAAISQPSSLQPVPVLSNVQGPTHEGNAPIIVPQINMSQTADISNTRNLQSTNAMPLDPQVLTMSRNVTYPANNLQTSMTSNISSLINQSRNQVFPLDQTNRTVQNMQPGLLHNIPSNFSSTTPNLNIANASPVIGQMQNNSNNILNAPQTNVTTHLVSNVPPVQTNISTNVLSVAPTSSTVTANIATTVGSIPPTMSPNIGVQMNMPLGIQNIHSGLPPSNQNMPPIPHGINSNMSMMMGPGLMPHTNIQPVYPTPISHQQERAALQQQIQEIYCMPPTPETQEKLQCLQERLAMLQQHETNEKCNGGPNCILQNPVYGSKMVESPQVSSTTGRGRSRGASRPRKPRAKKDKTTVSQPLDQLPVSEDCVTAGTGLHITNLDADGEFNEDVTNLDGNILQYDVNNEGKVKKPRRKYKERKPRVPKEPKPKPEKPIKERKKREPKDPNAPRRKRVPKKDEVDVQADTTTSYEFSESNETITKENSFTFSELQSERSTHKVTEPLKLEDGSVTDFDDIPVSKIPIKELLEEAEARRELEDKEDDTDSLCQSVTKKKVTKRKSIGGISCRKSSSKRLSGGKKKKRGGIVPESDGEPDDLMSTPPPSPPAEADCDSLKRRSARNTQRKKYTDDVMLRLSDEEFSAAGTHKSDRNLKLEQSNIEMKDVNKVDGLPKPNYIYVNTTDEDSMIVQHVLASRMGKREMKPDILQEKSDITKTEETAVNATNEDATKNTDTTNIKEEISTECVENTEIATNDKILEAEPIEDELIVKEIRSENPIIECPEISPEIQTINIIDIKNEKPVIVDIEEFYVKYRNFSYLHCEWKTEDELYKGDKRIFSKIKRFKQKQAQQVNIFELLDDEPFNPDYIEVERILDMSDTVDPGNENCVKHYLVKWKSLQYEDSTWELEEDIDVDKIRQFETFHEIPPKDKWKFKRKPPAEHWSQLKESPLYKGGNTLRPYQLEGLNWLLFSWHNNRNCILADEMGLGKTIQSLTYVNSIWEYGIRGPFLIIAPLSTIPNWQREFEAWTDMNVIVYHGSQQSKSMIQEYEFYYKSDGLPIKELTKFNVLITTFEIIVTDFQDLKTFNWRACVIDEAHRLKNRNCKLLEGLRQLHMEHRVLLSGTPLQNNVNELFSLLNFLEPAQFSSCDAFLSEFGQLKSESEVLKLQALLKPMMLRRLKEDVEKGLAPKEETIIEVELTNIQKKYYRAILERNFSFLRKGTNSAANIPNLMNTMMELRKCCIHPYLLNGAEDQIQFDYKQANGEDKQAYYEALIQSSGKMVLVDKLLPKLKAGGHRVLIFSQMVRCLDILEDYLMFRKYPYERIDGRIRGNLRQEAIDRFSKPDSDRFVFLLCTKAGGLGINLTAADTVIIYDSDWNPQNDLQAQARCHRIGQQKMVKIYRLICRNSYEREMFDKASLKLGLDKAILQSMNTSQGKETGLRQLSKKEIEDLLKKGAYGAVMDEDNAGDKFCEEDIEMILARRTQVIQMESEKGSTFSKASFASNDQRSDIDIRDPDFWNKWAKKAEIDPTEKNEEEDLIVTEPRRRTLIKRYGHDDSTMEMSDMDATPDSDDDEEGISLRSRKKKDRLGRKGRKYTSDDYVPRHESMAIEDEVVYGSWTRSECFKIERGLLTYGWARWDEIVDKNQFRKGWTLSVIEDCARIIVLYCLRHYKGDEKIRNFIWDLIEPCENGEVTISRNHSGLHNPVPRGRNAKKKNKPKDVPKPSAVQKWEDPNHWSSGEKYDCEAYLEGSYKKHLFRHANKVLLRVRMMYYIKHEVIGDYATQIEAAVHASGLGMRVPRGVDSAPPRIWWDSDCDVSLLVGTYVHGYENYLAMRSDPQLCFVDKLGPPDDAECTDIKSEERLVRSRGGDEDCTDDVSSGAGASPPREDDAAHPWPSMQDLNTRLRRLITAYQRNYKREELKMQQRAKKNERRDRIDQIARDEAAQWRWSRADEESFRRTVASYGVEFDPSTKSLRWSRFRQLASLDNKSDDALTDYLKAFMAMCKRQCGLSVGEAELPTRSDLKAEPIGEERAIATLERIDLLRVLREEVSPHPALEARLARCERSADAPPWWNPAAHDRQLVRAVCRHGLGDTYHKLFCDPKLPFAECAKKWSSANKMRTRSDKMSSDEEDEEAKTAETSETVFKGEERSSEPKDDEDTDALSELETLAKLGRSEELPPASLWFAERALESRLHHIAHTVQNARDRKHIAIDVETERAKLHALLSSPSPAHAPSAVRDDSSDSSRRSTPAPPPAHQRPPPSPAPGVSKPSLIDASTPLDLSDAQDLSRRTPAPSPAPSPGKSRLDDTLSRLMKRKNVPEQEVIVGKEKKRKKLDEIVLGLSAAKGQATSTAAAPPRPLPARPAPTPPPAAPPRRAYPPSPAPTTPAAHKEPASFLQQSLESGPKARPPAPKPFSQEAKVDKWLAEQAGERRRAGGAAPTPRLAPDEHVPVVHRVTGKRLVGHKAPQLKHLTQWIAENPLYDIDTKWTDGIKEHVKLPADARAPPRAPPPAPERKKGRPPSLDASAAHLNPALLASLSGLGGFDQKSLAATLSNLTGFDTKALGGFDPKLLASLNGYDPKNDPLLGSFNGVPNLLGNLTGGGLFSNLAGLGLAGFPGADVQAGADPKGKRKHSETGAGGKAASQFPFGFPNPNMLYPQLGLSGLNPFGMQAAGLSSAYDALGLLNSGLVTGAASFPGASTSRAKTTAPRASPAPSPASQSRAQKAHGDRHAAQRLLLPPDTHLLESLSKQCMSYDLPVAKPEKRSREADAPDPADFSKAERKKHHEPSRSRLPPELAAFQERLLKGDKRDVDISKMLLEQMASGALSASLVSSAESKRAFEMESLEKMSKNITDYSTRTPATEMPHKRRREDTADEPENLVMPPADAGAAKRVRDADDRDRPRSRAPEERPPAHAHPGEMDLEDLIAPSTVIRTGAKPNAGDPDKNKIDHPNILSKNDVSDLSMRPAGDEYTRREMTELDLSKDSQEAKDQNDTADAASSEEAVDAGEAGRRRRRGRKPSEDAAWGARRELRSSAGRTAR